METNTAENQEQSSYAERVQTIQSDTKKNIFKKKEEEQKKPKFVLSEKERELARRMIPFLASDGFKAFTEFESIVISSNTSNPFALPVDGLIQTGEYGEKMAFKQGFVTGVPYVKLSRETLVDLYLKEQEPKKED